MTANEGLLARLQGRDCPDCEGSVALGTYKGNVAVLCEACGTPTLQLFRAAGRSQ
jgi:hypothetical protein